MEFQDLINGHHNGRLCALGAPLFRKQMDSNRLGFDFSAFRHMCAKYVMPNKKIFCSSPWLHLKINYSGRYIVCRWQSIPEPSTSVMNIRDTSLLEFYNSMRMRDFRSRLLLNDALPECSDCAYEDSFGKTSGRIRQLYRSKLDDMDSFDDMYLNSPHYEQFQYSADNNGKSTGHPYDLQINLTNVCNGACIMCSPSLSSRLNVDYQKLTKYNPILFPLPKKFECWASDPVVVKKFVKDLSELPSIEYIHLLGGETLLLDSFYTICDALIESGLSKQIFLGTTTNLTVYSDRLEKIIPEFNRFHIGLSIESVNPLNDYIRYVSDITSALSTLEKFLALREKFPTIHLTLRITPNVFSIFYIDEVIQYMCDHNITGESCNILSYPTQLRIELLPDDLRLIAIEKLKKVIDKNSLERGTVVNARSNGLIKQVIAAVAYSYVDVLEEMTLPVDGEKCRHDLVNFIKGFESIRNNSILDYAPEFEPFLTSYGYVREIKTV